MVDDNGNNNYFYNDGGFEFLKKKCKSSHHF